MTPHSIVPRPTSASLGRPAPGAAPGGARSTADTTFDGSLSVWDDLPAETIAALASGTELARCVTSDRASAVLVDGRKYQAMHAWSASTRGVVVARALRALEPAGQGRLHPAGPWRHDRVSSMIAVRPPVHRRGAVEAGVGDRTVASGSGDTGAVAHAHREAAQAWEYLPAVVRAAAESTVPDPQVWRGQIVQSTSPEGFPFRQSLTVLRLGSGAAVVIDATRSIERRRSGDLRRTTVDLAAATWNVAQWTFELGTSSPERSPAVRA